MSGNGAPKGNQYAKGTRALTEEERVCQKIHKLDLMDRIHELLPMTNAQLKLIEEDPSTPAVDLIVIRLIRQGMNGDRDTQAIKILLDRLCGPITQHVKLSGNIYDFSTMTKEQKFELLKELRAARHNPAGE